ncbi:S1 family peptidase [Streptomyces akebiae]|uniref:S1 family peptidase n=1 Tax=Streptomyces akebiae TaxID=2865673 RepID=A0ABX8XTD8_9ACTN|nr:S1 family peptidase [Streptomyces akebiae]QYX79166.1 S1 family peptidase [Streptomyces akebiae]
MKLESAVELKDKLLEDFRLEEPVVARLGRRLCVAAAAERPSPMHVASFPDTGGFGIGVAVLKPGKYGIAVRVQSVTPRTHTLAARIRKEAHDEVDVQFIGRVNACVASLRPGVSIGHGLVTAGTLGAFVTLRDQPGDHVLSNNHVLAACDLGNIGDSILHPGTKDGSPAAPCTRIGSLSEVEKLRAHRAASNIMDAATCRLDDDVQFEPSPPHLRGVAPLALDVPVEKLGKATNHTTGMVRAIVDDVWVEYEGGNAYRFDGQFEVEGDGVDPFCSDGDSGAIVWHSGTSDAVGLLFARSASGGHNGMGVTYVNPLEPVLSRFGATLS